MLPEKPIVIIGGVAAGMSAASQLKRQLPDRNVIVIERGDYISYGACGMPFYVSGEIKDYNKLIVLKPEKAESERGINLKLRHEALYIDPKEKIVGVKNLENKEDFAISYDKLVIATGSSAIVPDIDGIDANGVFVLKELIDGIKINNYIEEKKPKKSIIIGGGFIGVEVAESFVKRGMDVTILEAAPRILTVLDEDFSKIAEDSIVKNSVNIIKNAKIKKINKNREGYVSEVVLESGEKIETELVLVSIGVKPNSELAKNAGLELGERDAILVDRFLRTSDENIFAAGDCATVYHKLLDKDLYIPLALGANRQGRMCGENIAAIIKGEKVEEFPGIIGTSMTKTFDLEIAKTGIGENEIKKYNLKDIESTDIKYFAKAGYYPQRSKIWVKLYFNTKNKKIVGAQIIGNDGSALRIDTVVASIYMGATVDDLYSMDLGYCPPFSPVWDPLLVVARQALKKE
ncbi:MAG TPA: FAD-dependent oxidoreductase [Spirochaetota bacterium]|nr:FAD-dependent oxidoreductase [Spirochaetota bacterium]HOM39074.1 FAD-dependent oxidoreductase [Spirochaetota bacterium]HPQ49980.1 FAD-dependent oxidoreductase [Spirochaetota bacterium]